MVIGSCGHALTEEEAAGFKNYVSTMDFDRDGSTPVIKHSTVCDPCKKWYEENGLLLKDEQQQQAYLNGEIKYPGK